MKVLFVANAYSTHTARWIAQLGGLGWEIHVFDPHNRLIHEELRGVEVHTGWRKAAVPPGTRVHCRWPYLRGRHFMARRLPRLWRAVLPDAPRRLARLIRRLRPDCVHALELQHNAAVVAAAQGLLGGRLPMPWIYSCQGSDLFHYRRSDDGLRQIRAVLERCDFYLCDCERDVRLARENGLRGEVLGVFPGGGGYPTAAMQDGCPPGPSSGRRIVAVKGLQTEHGNALLALAALRRCRDALDGFTVRCFQASPPVEDEVRKLRADGLPIDVVPRSPWTRVWSLLGEARLALGVSRSDGVPNAMLEAMVTGALPVWTNPGNASGEWIEDGVNGLLIPPDDVEAVAAALERALTDDDLVDRAARRNQELTRRVDEGEVRPRVLAAYRRAVSAGTFTNP